MPSGCDCATHVAVRPALINVRSGTRLVGPSPQSPSKEVLRAFHLSVSRHQASAVPLHAQEGAESQVRKLEKAWITARLKNDIAAANRLLAPDYFQTSAAAVAAERGNTSTQPTNVTPSGLPWVDSKLSDVRVKVYGETAVVTGLRSLTVRSKDGGTNTGGMRYIHVWHRGGEAGWQLVASQVTAVPEPGR